MGSSNLAKYNQDLIDTLSRLQNMQGLSGDLNDKLDYFITWFKIRHICLQIGKIDAEEKESGSIVSKLEGRTTHLKLLAQFKREIQPKLIKFTSNLKNLPFSDRILLFTERMRRYIEQSQYFIKDLPSEAMHVYENIWFFLQLFRFALDQKLIHNQMAILRKNMALLKQTFEIEAGSPDLVEQQTSLSSELRNSLKASSSPSLIASDSSVKTNAGQNISSPSSETPIMNSEISLPESSEEEEISLEEPRIHTIPSVEVKTIESHRYISVFPFHRWFPPQSVTEYWRYRFCINCGMRLNLASQACSNCGQLR